MANDAFRGAAEKNAAQPGVSVRAHDNKIHVLSVRNPNDFMVGRPETNRAVARDGVGNFLGEQLVHLLLARLVQSFSECFHFHNDSHFTGSVRNVEYVQAEDGCLKLPGERDRVSESFLGAVREINRDQNSLNVEQRSRCFHLIREEL